MTKRTAEEPAGVAMARELDDPGLANERTALAWTRSAISLAAVAVLIARSATLDDAKGWGYPLASVLLVGALGFWRHSVGVHEANRRAFTAREPLSRPVALSVLSALTLGAALGAIALTVLS